MIKTNWTTFKTFLSTNNINPQYVDLGSEYHLIVSRGLFVLSCVLDKNPTDTTELVDFETNFKSLANKKVVTETVPFASKILQDGKKLFRRVHGISATLNSATTTINYTSSYTSCKIIGLQVINGKIGDTVNFKILDTAEGTVSGIPNQLLNQFGFNVNILPSVADYPSKYDADLFAGLVLSIEYTSVVEDPERVIYINFDLHEVKD